MYSSSALPCDKSTITEEELEQARSTGHGRYAYGLFSRSGFNDDIERREARTNTWSK